MKNDNILVLGPKGKTGRKVADRLKKLGFKVREVSRNTSPSFDWTQPGTWAAALKGMDKVYINYPLNLAAPGAIDTVGSFAAVAVDAGISKLVMLSGRGEREAQMAEEKVMSTGADWTIVRSDWFFQNFSENFLLPPVQQGLVVLPKGDVKIPFIDTGDIADVIVAALTHSEHNGKIHELTGPHLITLKEAVTEIALATGKKIVFKDVSVGSYLAMLREYQVPEDEIELVRYLFTEILDGRNAFTTGGVQRAIGRPPRDFKEYVNETAGTGLWYGIPVSN